MWIPKWYFEAQIDRINDLNRRVKRLELMCLVDAKNKIASLQDLEAGTSAKDGCLTIEEVINKGCNTR